MTTDKTLTEFFEGLLRYTQYLPGDKETPFEVLILRGHLLIEEELREVIKAKFVEPRAYDLQHSKYSSLLRLTKALYGEALPEWRWNVAEEINVIRNSIAHQLKDDLIAPRLKRLFLEYKKNDNSFAYTESDPLKQLAYCLSAAHVSFLNIRTGQL